jgi:hypothetical protein
MGSSPLDSISRLTMSAVITSDVCMSVPTTPTQIHIHPHIHTHDDVATERKTEHTHTHTRHTHTQRLVLVTVCVERAALVAKDQRYRVWIRTTFERAPVLVRRCMLCVICQHGPEWHWHQLHFRARVFAQTQPIASHCVTDQQPGYAKAGAPSAN